MEEGAEQLSMAGHVLRVGPDDLWNYLIGLQVVESCCPEEMST